MKAACGQGRLASAALVVVALNVSAALALGACEPPPAPAMARAQVGVSTNGDIHAMSTIVDSRPVAASRSRVDMTVGLTKVQRKRTAFTTWRTSPTARRVAWRESRNRCRITNPSGKYQGRWQMDDPFWKTYGGRRYAPNPHQATCAEQDRVAYRGWKARGWQPWVTA